MGEAGEALETSRLRLEPLTPAHARALYAVYAEPEVARSLVSRPDSWESFQPIFENALAFAGSHGMWAVRLRQTGALVGRVGFFAFGAPARAELAFLLSAAAWGRGLATEACMGALAHALRVRAWPEVIAIVRPDNGAAVRVLAKLGFGVESELELHGGPARLYRASRAALVDLSGVGR